MKKNILTLFSISTFMFSNTIMAHNASYSHEHSPAGDAAYIESMLEAHTNKTPSDPSSYKMSDDLNEACIKRGTLLLIELEGMLELPKEVEVYKDFFDNSKYWKKSTNEEKKLLIELIAKKEKKAFSNNKLKKIFAENIVMKCTNK